MDPKKPVAAAKKAASAAVETVVDATTAMLDKPVPGAPGSEAPSMEEPTAPRTPPPPKPDQAAPTVRSATGATGATGAGEGNARAQQGAFLTTSTGARLADTDHSLKAGPRGPTLLQDHHLREADALRPRADT